ncbi:hypothetical protein ACEPT7_27930 [Burkholderia ubonensis]|uniref:hypothetical protein n=1 Tax=Burkholderia ubonensis TaxID=101571 RepID=UPI00358ECAF3
MENSVRERLASAKLRAHPALMAAAIDADRCVSDADRIDTETISFARGAFLRISGLPSL